MCTGVCAGAGVANKGVLSTAEQRISPPWGLSALSSRVGILHLPHQLWDVQRQRVVYLQGGDGRSWGCVGDEKKEHVLGGKPGSRPHSRDPGARRSRLQQSLQWAFRAGAGHAAAPHLLDHGLFQLGELGDVKGRQDVPVPVHVGEITCSQEQGSGGRSGGNQRCESWPARQRSRARQASSAARRHSPLHSPWRDSPDGSPAWR